MTIGIGGSNAKKELDRLTPFKQKIPDIPQQEYKLRIKKAQQLMRIHNIDATYINAGTNLYYFTGIKWHASERMLGAIIPAHGDVHYIAPYFELGTFDSLKVIKGRSYGWQEDECPYALFKSIMNSICHEKNRKIALDESTPFFITDGIRQQVPNDIYVNAKKMTAGCRMYKSRQEIALMQRAKDITLAVQKSAAKILYEGISTQEVTDFIHKAHIKIGAENGSYFCIVLFGKDTSFPHGVKEPKKLEYNDMVLIDTGCKINGYTSDITRSYVFGTANEQQRKIWNIEKAAQAKVFEAARIGNTCANVDKAARNYLTTQGFGPNYQLPGLPHRTGHGIGLDIHEWPYLVANDNTKLQEGMCFSNEPMLCIPDKFGVRLEDHFYMSSTGPIWFTKPADSIDNPFGYDN